MAKFKNRVYYGEYTLQHWMNLILSGNLELPEYQRSFVWEEKQSTELVHTFVNGEFVSPVTIGVYKDGDGRKRNIIIDGQQRLTSILLAYAKCYPLKEKFIYTEDLIADADEDVDGEQLAGEEAEVQPEEADNVEEQVEPQLVAEELQPIIMEWTFNKLLELGKNIEEIRAAAEEDEKYKEFKPMRDFEEFFTNNYLGFSLLVPNNEDANQAKYYSSVFKNVNSHGVPLVPMEIRRAQYFLDPALQPFFEPEFCKEFKIHTNKNYQLDYVRYLSWLWNYKKNDEKEKQTAVNLRYKGRNPNEEEFYGKFINEVVKEYHNQDPAVDTLFGQLFAGNDFKPRYEILKENIRALQFAQKSFPSIIDADLYFFGLVYVSLFDGKKLQTENIPQLKEQISKRIENAKKSAVYRKDPKALTRTRARLKFSIQKFRSNVEP